MFLFSGTFFPLDTLPEPVAGLRAADAAVPRRRPAPALAVGVVGPDTLVHVAYLLVMGFVGLAIVSRRLDKLLLK